MAQETVIRVWCDFSSQVKKHAAHYRIVKSGNGGLDHLDVCKGHLSKMIDAMVDTADITKIVLERIENNAAEKPKVAKPPTGEEHKCAACGESFDTPQGVALHFRRRHGGR